VLKADDRNDEDEAPPARRKIRITPMRVVAAVLAVAVFATTAFGWGTKNWLGSSVRQVAALDSDSGAVVDAAAQRGDENVLLVASENSTAGTDAAAGRADTVAVAHIPAEGGPVTVVAFPNDLEINRPPCEKWDPASASYGDQPVPAEARTQLMSALDKGGPRCLTRVVQQLSGLAITTYIGTNLAAVPALADAVGGVEVCVPRPVLDGVLGPVVPEPGTRRIEGVRAADFVRAGDVSGDPSPEYGRIERQQQVLGAVLGQAMSGTALLDVGRIAALRPALGDAVMTDGADLDELLALTSSLRRLDADGVTFAALPTGERTNRGSVVLRDTDAAALFSAVRTDAPLPETARDPSASGNGPSPNDVTIEVLNASSRSGLAGQVGETLRSLGFGISEVRNAEQPTPQTVIRFSPDQAAAAALLAATVPSATSVPDPGASGVLQLVLGRSFDDVVRAPSEPIALAESAAPVVAAPAANCT
jgi:LCP family protein required for cell wall assembly